MVRGGIYESSKAYYTLIYLSILFERVLQGPAVIYRDHNLEDFSARSGVDPNIGTVSLNGWDEDLSDG